MPRVQQLVTQDESTAGGVEQRWLQDICDDFGRPERLPAEITQDRTERDTNVTTVWSKGRVVALAVRQRDQANYTVLTLIQVADGEAK